MDKEAGVDIRKPMLAATGIRAGYGRLEVLHEVSLEVGLNESIGLIGHNGAGKSTLLRVLAGVLKSSSGVIKAGGGGALPRTVLVPQGHSVFPHMTVFENLEMVRFAGRGGSERFSITRLVELFPVLNNKLKRLAGNLSGGEQQALAIAMGLRRSPELLLLDEPLLGIAPALGQEILDTVDEVRRTLGFSVVTVEQAVGELLVRCDRLVALSRGNIVWQGSPSDVRDARELWQWF